MHILFCQIFRNPTILRNIKICFFVPQFLSRLLRTCGYRRNGTTASGSAGTFHLHPPWATGSSTSPYLVSYTHKHTLHLTDSLQILQVPHHVRTFKQLQTLFVLLGNCHNLKYNCQYFKNFLFLISLKVLLHYTQQCTVYVG